MPIAIQGSTYFTGSEIAAEIGVTRQTLWRWRKQEKIPQGWKHRDGRVVFTPEERDIILDFANRVEPVSAEESSDDQLGLFNGVSDSD